MRLCPRELEKLKLHNVSRGGWGGLLCSVESLDSVFLPALSRASGLDTSSPWLGG